MIGRPVARCLARDGFQLRALVRDPARASRMLPGAIELCAGDLRDAASVDAAMRGVDAVYINLATPRSEREPYDPERDGTPVVLAAARRAGVRRVLKISAMGVPETRGQWWAIDRKARVDEALMAGGIAYTIFRPTWFMESLPLFIAGPFMLDVNVPRDPLWWVSGADYAGQVAAALRDDRTMNRVFTVQGPEPATFHDAVRRFLRAFPKRLWRMPVPMTSMRLAARLMTDPRYLVDLFDMTFPSNTRFTADGAWAELGRPTMTIEAYVRSIAETGDLPRK
jgi:uncharacterized protein YbjT (DUF2867 family)